MVKSPTLSSMDVFYRGVRRYWSHLTFTRGALHRHFPPASLDKLQDEIASGEQQHRAELRVVIEGCLTLPELIAETSPNARALDLFSKIRVWDTTENNGILLYILLAERAIELIADRNIHQLAGEASWRSIVDELQSQFQKSNFSDGLLAVITKLNAILAQHFPILDRDSDRNNELSDRPLIIL